jgi:uncharacterized protein YybS (DUF2232 family)
MWLALVGVLIFGILTFAISFAIVRRYKNIEPSQMATYIVLIAWGRSFLAFSLIVSHASHLVWPI